MIPTFTPPHGPQPGYERSKEPKVKNNPFGDNYTQSIPDGINNLLIKSVDLEWKLLTWDEAEAMESFMDDLLGTAPFYYTLAPDSFPRKWRCQKYGSVPEKGDNASFRATFQEQP